MSPSWAHPARANQPLLNILGCLDTPTRGEYLLDGIPVRTMSKSQRAVLRNRKIGFVFQELQPAAQDHGSGECRAAAPCTIPRSRLPNAADAPSRPSWPWDSATAWSISPTKCRAARCKRVAIARALGEQPRRNSGRRGHRQPRHAHLVRNTRALPTPPRRGTNHHLRHPQPRHRPVQQPQHPAARRGTSSTTGATSTYCRPPKPWQPCPQAKKAEAGPPMARHTSPSLTI